MSRLKPENGRVLFILFFFRPPFFFSCGDWGMVRYVHSPSPYFHCSPEMQVLLVAFSLSFNLMPSSIFSSAASCEARASTESFSFLAVESWIDGSAYRSPFPDWLSHSRWASLQGPKARAASLERRPIIHNFYHPLFRDAFLPFLREST